MYFGDLFKSAGQYDCSLVLDSIPSVISSEINQQLTREIEEGEVFAALKQMHPAKSPGPDGFSPCFYQKY